MPKKVNQTPEIEKLQNNPIVTGQTQLEVVLEACNNDLEVAQFFVIWLQNGRHSTNAYLTLHPEVTERSASVLGSRVLAKVNKRAIMQAYGLTPEMYFQQLYDGAQATMWNDFTGKEVPDHKTRKAYHDKLGKHLEYESDTATLPGQININNIVGSWAGVNNADTKS